mmetsp:Transcript_11506/g.25471  ORF Transcript_11506/g.25471 Transcript_11506/m.25471 type:complete len:155 (+) Transcript_11506:6-470(+)
MRFLFFGAVSAGGWADGFPAAWALEAYCADGNIPWQAIRKMTVAYCQSGPTQPEFQGLREAVMQAVHNFHETDIASSPAEDCFLGMLSLRLVLLAEMEQVGIAWSEWQRKASGKGGRADCRRHPEETVPALPTDSFCWRLAPELAGICSAAQSF